MDTYDKNLKEEIQIHRRFVKKLRKRYKKVEITKVKV